MASDKQTMDLHTRRMVISANPIKGHKKQFYSWDQANEKTTRRWFIESWWPGAESNQGRGCLNP